MKRVILGLMALLICLCPVMALSDALTETELNLWIDELLRSTVNQQPLNAPVGEESLTDGGYAFLYEHATLYYNKPDLDAASILQAAALTDESFVSPRGIRLGDTAEQVIEAFGQQNPFLLGDDSFATLYWTDELPRAAYWGWAQLGADESLVSVQCALHVQAGEDRYTDAGVRLVLEDGVVTEIRVYGLVDYVALADVQANLEAVRSVEDAVGLGALNEEAQE